MPTDNCRFRDGTALFLRNQVKVHFRYFTCPQRRGYCHSVNPRPFKTAWHLSALKSFPSLLSLASMPDTHMGGRLLDLGAQPVRVGEVTLKCCCSFSQLGSEWFPLAPYPGHVWGCQLPTRVAQTHFCAASLCLPTYLLLGELKLLFLVIHKKSLSLDGVLCAFIDLVTGMTEAFPSPGCVISARALEQGLALAAGLFPVLPR